jgi:hypothetical protein
MRAPLEELAPGSTCKTLAPREPMVCWMAAALPLPISIMAMTAAMPITIPRHVRAERNKFRRKSRTAARKLS